MRKHSSRRLGFNLLGLALCGCSPAVPAPTQSTISMEATMPVQVDGQTYYRELRTWLRREMKESARRAFDFLRQKYPKETFYAYVLTSMDYCEGVVATAQTEEGYKRVLKRYENDKDFDRFKAGFRWRDGEWGNHVDEGTFFGKIGDRINEPELRAFRDKDEDTHSPMQRASYMAAMTLALHDLDQEGYFGQGTAREKITLFCSFHDGSDLFEYLSSRFLNPKAVFDSHSQEMMPVWDGYHKNITDHMNEPSPTDVLYEEYLKGRDPTVQEIKRRDHEYLSRPR
jgi:hypothetical protein